MISGKASFTNGTTIIIRGGSKDIGFVQIKDKRYAMHPDDYQGEGYVLDWDQLGFSINEIGATEEQLADDKELVRLTEKFIETLE